MYMPLQPEKPWSYIHVNNQCRAISNWLIQVWDIFWPDLLKYSRHNNWHSASLITNFDYLFQFFSWGINFILYSVRSAQCVLGEIPSMQHKKHNWGLQYMNDKAWNHFMIQLIQSSTSTKKILVPVFQDVSMGQMNCMYFKYDKEKTHATGDSVWVLQLLSMKISIGLCQS